MRSRENTIYFASVNYALRFQESATSLIDPSGQCQAYLPYGQEGVLVQAIDIEKATGLLAGAGCAERHEEQRASNTFGKVKQVSSSSIEPSGCSSWRQNVRAAAPLTSCRGS